LEYFFVVFFGWPAAIVGSILIITGISLGKHHLCFLGAVVSAGFCVYISMNPMPFRVLGLLALLSNFACALAVQRSARRLASVLTLPYLVVGGYLAYAVIAE
jgi:hypothetical protein